MADNITGGVYLSAWSQGENLLFVGGDYDTPTGVLARLSGDELCIEADVADQVLWWIHGADAGTWTAVGESGVIVREVEGVRTREDVPTDATLFGVFDTGQVIWAVGGDPFANTGEVWRRVDGEWSLLATDPNAVLFKVWEDWIVGDGVAYRIDGDQLVPEPLPNGETLRTVRGASVGQVWAVGGTFQGEVLHHDGTQWNAVETDERCAIQPLNGVWTGEGFPVAVAGNFGTAALVDEGEWSCAEFPITAEHFHATWHHNDVWYFVGGNLFASQDYYGTIGRYGTPRVAPVRVTFCDDEV